MKRLTEKAQEDRDQFDVYAETYCCSCHLNPPCGYCTHPGNPRNQEEDESCWEIIPDADYIAEQLLKVRENVRALALQALAVLVIDLGYSEAPIYGHNPIRHQLLWVYVEQAIGKAWVEKEIPALVAIREKEKEESSTGKRNVFDYTDPGNGG